MHYPEDVDKVVNLELKKLIEMCKNHEGPFNNDVIYEYYEKYKELTNK